MENINGCYKKNEKDEEFPLTIREKSGILSKLSGRQRVLMSEFGKRR